MSEDIQSYLLQSTNLTHSQPKAAYPGTMVLSVATTGQDTLKELDYAKPMVIAIDHPRVQYSPGRTNN